VLRAFAYLYHSETKDRSVKKLQPLNHTKNFGQSTDWYSYSPSD